MPQVKVNGVVLPHRPGHVINVRSKKSVSAQNVIRLDKLIMAEKPRILIKRRLGGIGDVIMSTPLLKKLKKLIPNCELTYATDLKYSNGALAEVIKHNPYVDVLLGNGTPRESEYDYVVDITATGLSRERSGSIPPNRIDMFAEEVGIHVNDDPVPDYVVTELERKKAKQELLSMFPDKKKKIIAIQARSNDARRTWPLDSVQKLADLLSAREDYGVLLFDWGHSIDKWYGNPNLIIIRDLPLEETAALVEQVDLVVCPDSSILHLAGALKKRIVSIFGPIPAESRINHYANAVAVQLKLACSNCWYSNKCGKHTGHNLQCLTSITPETVMHAVDKKILEPEMTLSMLKAGKEVSLKGQDPVLYVKRRFGGLGDILMTTPALKVLKEKYPDKQLHVAIPPQYHEILENLPFVDRIISSDLTVNLKSCFLSADISDPCARYEFTRIQMKKPVEKSRVEVFAEALGVRNMLTNFTPIYNVSEDEIFWAKGYIASRDLDPSKKLIAVCLNSAEAYRDYPSDKQELIIAKLSLDYNIVLIGSHSKNYNNVINTKDLSIRKWASVLNECSAFISVDTGPLHVAAALNIPTIALFGPIDYKARCKGYNNVTAIVADLPCVPCWRNVRIKCQQSGTLESSKCMSLPTNIIIQKLKEVLDDTKGI